MAARDLLDAALDDRPSRSHADPEVVTEASHDPETVADADTVLDPEASVTY